MTEFKDPDGGRVLTVFPGAASQRIVQGSTSEHSDRFASDLASIIAGVDSKAAGAAATLDNGAGLTDASGSGGLEERL